MADEYAPKSPDLSSFSTPAPPTAQQSQPPPVQTQHQNQLQLQHQLPPHQSPGFYQSYHQNQHYYPQQQQQQQQQIHHTQQDQQHFPHSQPQQSAFPYGQQPYSPTSQFPQSSAPPSFQQDAYSHPQAVKNEFRHLAPAQLSPGAQQQQQQQHSFHQYYQQQPQQLQQHPQQFLPPHVKRSSDGHELSGQHVHPPYPPQQQHQHQHQQYQAASPALPSHAGQEQVHYQAPIPQPLPTQRASPSSSKMPPRKAAAPPAAPPTEVEPSPVKTKFPTARIKRIMQADEEVGKVAQQTPIAVGKALEMFMINVVSKSADIAKEKGSKRVTAQMLKQVIENDPGQYDFLADIAAKVGDEEKRGRGGAGAKAESETSEEEPEEEAPPPKKRGRGGGRKKRGGAA